MTRWCSPSRWSVRCPYSRSVSPKQGGTVSTRDRRANRGMSEAQLQPQVNPLSPKASVVQQRHGPPGAGRRYRRSRQKGGVHRQVHLIARPHYIAPVQQRVTRENLQVRGHLIAEPGAELRDDLDLVLAEAADVARQGK